MGKIIDKPWGHEEILIDTKGYKVKILSIKAGHGLSIQYHRGKEETLFYLEGECRIETYRYRNFNIEIEGCKTPKGFLEFVHIPPGVIHSIKAITDSRFLEVNNGVSDSDIERLYDSYNR